MAKTETIMLSKTNPADRVKGPDFEELKASIKAKGVLMPILVRKTKAGLEVVAGNRRYAAAKALGLDDKDIPMRIVEKMSDEEAREAQIIENLQRKDIHPIEEGAAYKELIDNSKPKLEVAEIAARVGKSATYVRGRLLLTNLDEKLAKKVRNNDLALTNAIELARLSKPAQLKLVSKLERSVYGGINCELKTLRKMIAEETFTTLLAAPPWKDDEAMKQEIARITGIKSEDAGANLFGEKGLSKIEDPTDYARALAAYISLTVERYGTNNKELTLVSDNYHTNTKNLIARNDYETDKVKGCTGWHDALIIEGDNVGKIIKICSDKSCIAHHPRQHERAGTPEQEAKRKAQRQNEIAKEKAKRQADTDAMAAAVKKMAWPITEKQLDVLIELATRRASHDVHQGICKRREIEAKKEKNYHGRNYSGAVLELAKTLDAKGKAGLLFELLVQGYSPNYPGDRMKAIKKL